MNFITLSCTLTHAVCSSLQARAQSRGNASLVFSLLSEFKIKKKSQVHFMKMLERCDLLHCFPHRICVINPRLHQLFHANALSYFTNCFQKPHLSSDLVVCGISPSWRNCFLLPLITTCSFSVGLMVCTFWASEHACAVCFARQQFFPFFLFHILLAKLIYPFIFL